MAQMVRKQIYISKHQVQRLKMVAKARNVSEAEVIRQALENELQRVGYHSGYDHEAWKRIEAAMRKMDDLPPVPQRKRDWKREDLYEERMKRYDR
jgi:hypothetical protein